MTQYIVLHAISPASGPLILPSSDGEPPVLIDEAALFASPSEFFSVEERATILIDKGVIARAPAKVVAAHEKAAAREAAITDKE